MYELNGGVREHFSRESKHTQANKSEQKRTHTHKRSRQAKQLSEHTQTVKMPGAKGKKRGHKGPPPPRHLSFKDGSDPNQYYGRVVKLWGHGMVTVRYYGAGNKSNPEEKMREIRAKVPIRRRQNKLKAILEGLVIISIRSFGSETTGDVIHTYRDGEESTLRRMKEIPEELVGGSKDTEADLNEIQFAHEGEFDMMDELDFSESEEGEE